MHLARPGRYGVGISCVQHQRAYGAFSLAASWLCVFMIDNNVAASYAFLEQISHTQKKRVANHVCIAVSLIA